MYVYREKVGDSERERVFTLFKSFAEYAQFYIFIYYLGSRFVNSLRRAYGNFEINFDEKNFSPDNCICAFKNMYVMYIYMYTF